MKKNTQKMFFQERFIFQNAGGFFFFLKKKKVKRR